MKFDVKRFSQLAGIPEAPAAEPKRAKREGKGGMWGMGGQREVQEWAWDVDDLLLALKPSTLN